MLRKTLIAIVSVCFLLTLDALNPANAINRDDAVKLCDRRPKSCKWRDDTVSGDTIITVDGSTISCPIKGDCTCTICPGSKPKKGAGRGDGFRGTSVVKVLTAPARSSPPRDFWTTTPPRWVAATWRPLGRLAGRSNR